MAALTDDPHPVALGVVGEEPASGDVVARIHGVGGTVRVLCYYVFRGVR
jgi:hypothetical protein